MCIPESPGFRFTFECCPDIPVVQVNAPPGTSTDRLVVVRCGCGQEWVLEVLARPLRRDPGAAVRKQAQRKVLV